MYENLDIITIGESLIEFSTDKPLSCADTFTKYYGGDTLAGGPYKRSEAALRLGILLKLKTMALANICLMLGNLKALIQGRLNLQIFKTEFILQAKKITKLKCNFTEKKRLHPLFVLMTLILTI